MTEDKCELKQSAILYNVLSQGPELARAALPHLCAELDVCQCELCSVVAQGAAQVAASGLQALQAAHRPHKSSTRTATASRVNNADLNDSTKFGPSACHS